MKNYTTFFFLFLTTCAFSQNWEVLNPDWGPHYGHTNSDQITNSIRYAHIDEIGFDSTHYIFQPHFEKCLECNTYPDNCIGTMQDTLFVKVLPLLGDSVSVYGSEVRFHGRDLIIYTDADLNDTWTYSGSDGDITGEISSIGEIEIFDVMDSVKAYSFSNGSELVLSKSFGVMEIADEGEFAFELKGIPELQVGTYFPSMREFYDFEVGDVFMFAGEEEIEMDANKQVRVRVDITDVLIFEDSTQVTMDITSRWSYGDGSGPFDLQNLDVQRTISFINNEIVGVLPNQFVQSMVGIGPIFNLNLQNLNEEQPILNVDQSTYFGRDGIRINYSSSRTNESPLIQPDLCCSSFAPDPNDELNLVGTSSGCCVYNFETDTLRKMQNQVDCFGEIPTFGIEWIEGLGVTSWHLMTGLADLHYYMIGFTKNGQTHGAVDEVSMLLPTSNAKFDSGIEVFPNPSHDNVQLQSSQQIKSVTLYDITGHTLFQSDKTSENIVIDISILSSGVYLLEVETKHDRVLQKVVKY